MVELPWVANPRAVGFLRLHDDGVLALRLVRAVRLARPEVLGLGLGLGLGLRLRLGLGLGLGLGHLTQLEVAPAGGWQRLGQHRLQGKGV